MSVFENNALARSRDRVGRYVDRHRGKIEAGVGQAKTAAEIAAGAYAGARMSAHLGGPEGKTIAGVPLELGLGIVLGVAGYANWAGKYSEDVIALGIGSAAGWAARKGFEAGMKTTKDAGNVSGAEVGADALDQAMEAVDAWADS